MPTNVGLEEKMPVDFLPIRKGTVLRMFDARCTEYLHKFPDDNYASNPTLQNFELHRTPSSQKRVQYFQLEQAHEIILKDDTNFANTEHFAKKGYVLRMKIREFIKCPFDVVPVLWQAGAQYSEAIIGDGITSDWVTKTGEFTKTGSRTVELDLSTPSIGDPYSWDSTGVGQVHIKAEMIDTDNQGPYDPSNTCAEAGFNLTYTITSMGVPIDRFAGMSPVQTAFVGCRDFQTGRGAYTFWTTNNFGPHGPFPGIVGLVSGLAAYFTGVASH